MKQGLRSAIGFILFVFVSSFVVREDTGWPVQQSKVTFEIPYWLGTCKGSIGGLKGFIVLDTTDLSKSKMDVSLDVATLETGNKLRDKHLKTKRQWFDADSFPSIRFHSLAFVKTDTAYLVKGELTMKSIVKPIVLPFHFTSNQKQGIFKGKFRLNRLDFGVGKATWMLQDTVHIVVEVQTAL